MADVTDRPGQTLEVDDTDGVDDDAASDTTSVASSLIRGHIENGRRYNALREDYWGPSDGPQFESMDSGHFVHLILLSDTDNQLFRAPIPAEKLRRVLDVGCGTGAWAIDCADKFPDATVTGVDLFPPQNTWVPPNCFLEVEDITREWTWSEKFDLIRLSYLLGAFNDHDWRTLYKRAYDGLEEGGWIEQVEPDCRILCDDGSLPSDSYAAGWGETFFACAERMGHSIKTIDEMRTHIQDAGFTNVQEQYIKLPIGPWAKDTKLKEAGRVCQSFWEKGLDGFAMFLLTKYGSPQPWTQEEVLAYTAKVRAEVRNPKHHAYHFIRRMWAQKPTAGAAAEKELLTLDSTTSAT